MTQTRDFALLYLWGVLVVVGVLALASVSVHVFDAWVNKWLLRHLAYVALSAAALGVFYALPTQPFYQFHRVGWLVALLFAAAVLVPGIGIAEGGSRRWIPLHFFTLQVSEVIKPLLIVFVAGYLAKNYESVQRSLGPLLLVLFAVGVGLALVFVEPDYGTVAIMGLVVVGMLFMANARMSHLLLLGSFALTGIGALLAVEPYRVARLMTLLSPWDEEIRLNEGYQLTNSLIAFARGEVTGTGLGTGLQKTFTPASHNDFIFATIAEETGLLGATLVLVLILALVYKLGKIARKAMQLDQHFESLFCYGVALLIGFQALIHIGVNAGVFPTKGLTLPFMSYGGNSLVILSALVGMALKIHRDQMNAS